MISFQYPKDKLERLKARYADKLEALVIENTDVPVLYTSTSNLLALLNSLKQEEGFEYNFLSDLTAIDENPPTNKISDYGLAFVPEERVGFPRFEIVYNLLSMQHKDRIRVKVRVQENQDIPSVTSIWKAANWLEREIYDMYGVKFSDHPNLRRILMDERWVGHPQRKDYPIKRYQRFEGSMEMKQVGLEYENS